MKTGEILAVWWLLRKPERGEMPEPAKEPKKPEYEFDPAYATLKGRRIGFLFFLAALVTAIVSLFMHHPFIALLAAFASTGGLICPFLKRAEG